MVDAESELSFMTALSKLKYRWNNLEKSCISSGTEPQFHAWFCKFKADDIIRCVLPDVRSRAGTDPCKMFTTNSSEAINHIIKQEVQWRENKLPTLIEHLKTITAQHQAELEKAIIGRGEWHFCSEYTYLQVSESVWFSSMKSEAKDKHLKKVQTCQLKQPSPSATAESQIASAGADRGATCSTRLSVSVQNCGLSKVSQSTLEGIWKKAEILIHSVGNILKAPWILMKRLGL